MSDWPARSTRRGFLAFAGTTVIAGCNGLWEGQSEDKSPKISGSDLQDAISSDLPTLPETVPVAVEASYLDDRIGRVQERLSSVPAPFGTEEVPNGAIRAELTRTYGEATAALEATESAATPFEAMNSLGEARECAYSVAAAWEAIDAELTRSDVKRSAPAVQDAIETFRERWRYVGDDPIRAVLVHERIETRVGNAVRQAARVVDPRRRGREDPIAVGELAARLEGARASLDDASHIYDQYTASVDDRRRFRSTFEDASESLIAAVADRRGELPEGDRDDPSSFVDREIDGTPVARALSDLYSGVSYASGLEDERSAGQLASVVLSAHWTLVRIRAFESLRQRVADGEHVTVERASDVRTLRERAIRAIEEADASNAHSKLNREILSDLPGFVEFADEEIEPYTDQEEVRVRWITRDLGSYVVAASMAKATPPASAEIAEAIWAAT